jgi:hypothetical protein
VLLEPVVGLCAGLYLTSFQRPDPKGRAEVAYLLAASVGVCVSLGLAALPVVFLVTGVLLRLFSPLAMPAAGAFGIAALTTILSWRAIDQAQILLGYGTSAAGLILATVAMLVAVPLLFPIRRPKLHVAAE